MANSANKLSYYSDGDPSGKSVPLIADEINLSNINNQPGDVNTPIYIDTNGNTKPVDFNKQTITDGDTAERAELNRQTNKMCGTINNNFTSLSQQISVQYDSSNEKLTITINAITINNVNTNES